MADLNVVVLSGYVASETELKRTTNGTPVCKFRLAVRRPGVKDKTDFFDVICWRSTAEFVSRYFRKGKRIEVSGTLETREWTDKEDKRHSVVEVQAKEVCFGEKAETEKDKGQPRQQEPEASANYEELPPDDDLPF